MCTKSYVGWEGSNDEAATGGIGNNDANRSKAVVTKYLRSGSLAQRGRGNYITALRKCSRWGGIRMREGLGDHFRCYLEPFIEDSPFATVDRASLAIMLLVLSLIHI